MINKFLFACCCMMVILLPRESYAQDTATHVYSLHQCVDIALKNNPDVKQSEFQVESARISWQQSRAGMLPDISGGASRSIYNGKSIDPYTNTYVNQQYTADSYGLNASVVLWNGSGIQHFIRQNSLAYQAGKMDLQQAKDQLTISVILDYLAVLNQQEQLKMATQQAQVTQHQVHRLSLQNDKGAIAPSELYKMRGQLASNQLTVLSTENALTSARLSLAQLMNIPYAPGMQLAPLEGLSPVAYDATKEEIYEYALENLAIVKAADLHEKSAEKGIKAARSGYFPTLSLSGGLYTNYSSAATTQKLLSTSDEETNSYILMNNNKLPVYKPVSVYDNPKVSYGDQWQNNFNSGLSLNLQIPILHGMQTRSRVKLAKVAERQAAFQKSTVKTQLRQAIERDYVNMMTAYKTYSKLLAQVEDYSESLREATVKFEAGVLTSVDFVIAQNDLNQSKLNLVSAKYNYILQTKILDYYRGKMSW